MSRAPLPARGAPALVLAAHGTRDPAGVRVLRSVAHAVGDRLGAPVTLAFADVCRPALAEALAGCAGPAVVVPAFLASGYHVTIDVPAQVASSGRAGIRVSRPLGPDALLVAALRDRLAECGLRPGDAVVLAAAGSAGPAAVTDVHTAARRLRALTGGRVGIGFLSAGGITAGAAVRAARAAGYARVAIGSWLLAPGVFATRLARAGADMVSAPLGAHPAVVDVLTARFLAAAGNPVGSPPGRSSTSLAPAAGPRHSPAA